MTYDIGVDVALDDELTLFASIFSENVIENQNSLVSKGDHLILIDAQPGGGTVLDASNPASRNGVDIGLTYLVNRAWESNIRLTTASYSDDNSLLRLHVANMLNITLPPKELKVSLVYDYQDFGNENQDDYQEDVGAARYFAPNGYTSYAASIGWRQWIGKDFFKGANQTWYDLAYSSIWDSEGDNYDNIRATFNYDFDDHTSLLVKTSLLNSAYYNSTSAFFGFDYRF
jgi:hypothetical protein